MDNHTVTGCVYLSLAKKKKKPYPTKTCFVYMFYFYNLFFLGEKIEGRGGRSM